MKEEKILQNILKKLSEKYKISIRNIRRKFIDQIKNLEKEKSISIDESKKFQDDVQKCTDNSVQEIEKITKDKEQEILKV